jgi:hypothetical protein
MVLVATGLDDDRCYSGRRERALDLAFGINSWGLFFWQTSL